MGTDTAAGEIRDGYDAWKALDAQERATAAAEDRAACAWELTGALGLTVRVKGDDLVIDPDDVDQWWPSIRDRVVRAYRETL